MANGSEAVKEMLKNDDLLGRPPVGPFGLLADLVDGRRMYFPLDLSVWNATLLAWSRISGELRFEHHHSTISNPYSFRHNGTRGMEITEKLISSGSS